MAIKTNGVILIAPFALDKAKTKSEFSSSLQSVLSEVAQDKKNKFSVAISEITIDQPALNSFKQKVQSVINTLDIKGGATITVSESGLGDVAKKAKSAADAISVVTKSVSSNFKAIEGKLLPFNGKVASGEYSSKYNANLEEYNRLLQERKVLEEQGSSASLEDRQALEQKTLALRNSVDEMERARVLRAAEIKASERAVAQSNKEASQAEKAAIAQAKAQTAVNDEYRKQEGILNRVKGVLDGNLSMKKPFEDESNANRLAEYAQKLEAIIAKYKGVEKGASDLQAEVSELNKEFGDDFVKKLNAGNIRNTKPGAQTGVPVEKNLAALISPSKTVMDYAKQILTVSRVFTSAVRYGKQMVQTVTEIDSALSQLRIITKASDIQMERFLVNATELARGLGSDIKSILGSIETFSRLGYGLEDATELARIAGIISNTADVELGETTTGLTSIIKGFDMKIADAEHVADVLIEVGQKYAISAGELMEAYEKSSAALSATNTSFEKSAGLLAAANASVQNASTVGKLMPRRTVMCVQVENYIG